MELKLIPHKTCPACGARVVAESCEHHHCNGQGFEERRFACGCVYRWSPNAERLENPKRCPKADPVAIARREKRQKAKGELVAFINKLDIDEDWRQFVLGHIQYTPGD